jgi:hypothetical protein
MGFRRFLRAGKRPRRLKGAAAFSRKGKKEDKDMKKNGRLILAAVVVVLLIAVFAVIWFATRPATTEGSKTITVEVVHKDESTKTFTYHTDAEYLGEVLLAEGLVEGDESEYGLMITTVDGEQAVYETDGAYWAFYVGDEYASLGVDQTPIADGDSFSLVYTVG